MRLLESDRLILQPVAEDDLDALLELRWDKDIMQHLVHVPLSSAQQRDWFHSLKSNDVALSIFVKSGDTLELAGTIGLYDLDARHQLATWRLRLAPSAQGKGIGAEATTMLCHYGFSILNLHKICSTSFAENTAILKLSEKIGFKREGLLREHFFNRGEFRDVVVFGLIRSDFEAGGARLDE